MSTYNDASLIYYPSGYKAGKAYSLKPTDGSGDLTFTRASTATRVNAAGLIESVATGVPRIDFTGGGCGKLLLEPQRTNLVRYSEEFNNWLIPPTFTTIETESLKGSIIFSNFGSAISQGITLTSNADTTISVFAKKSNWNFLQIRTVNFDASASARTWFDLLNGTVGSTDIPSRHFNQSIEDFGGGWYRCSLTFKSITDLSGSIQLAGSQSDSSTISGANSGEDIFFDMSQVELGSYPTSYIPTTTTAVTRVADSAIKDSLSVFGTNVGSFFVDAEGPHFDGAAGYLFDLSDNVNSSINRFAIYSANSTNLTLFTNASLTFAASVTARKKIVVIWNGTNTKLYLNGVKVGDFTYANANPTSINLNSRYNETQYGNSKFNQVLAFPTALSDTDAIALTTI